MARLGLRRTASAPPAAPGAAADAPASSSPVPAGLGLWPPRGANPTLPSGPRRTKKLSHEASAAALALTARIAEISAHRAVPLPDEVAASAAAAALAGAAAVAPAAAARAAAEAAAAASARAAAAAAAAAAAPAAAPGALGEETRTFETNPRQEPQSCCCFHRRLSRARPQPPSRRPLPRWAAGPCGRRRASAWGAGRVSRPQMAPPRRLR
mmetsp:Transcript_2020/g.7830  ORF Transcript_2020/g.7830 Transcript_2020/m.7830 type:complete len:211 (+) Transcript_2020:704-1336(+)